jgi:hypothetical protein
MEPITSYDAIGEIFAAWRAGRPIVPLFGAGISVESGIPLTRPMETYLARLKWFVESTNPDINRKANDTRNVTEYLLAHGWPEPHDLTAKLISQLVSTNDHRRLVLQRHVDLCAGR